MKREDSKRRMYFCPMIETISVKIENILDASGDHSGIGQGGTVGDAKQWNFFEGDDEEMPPVDENVWEI